MSERHRFTITCDRSVADELLAELTKDSEAAVSLGATRKNLSGLDILTIIADLTTIGANLLTVWLAARPHLQGRVVVKAVEDEDS